MEEILNDLVDQFLELKKSINSIDHTNQIDSMLSDIRELKNKRDVTIDDVHRAISNSITGYFLARNEDLDKFANDAVSTMNKRYDEDIKNVVNSLDMEVSKARNSLEAFKKTITNGIDGIDGTNGKNGLNGKDGRDGIDGTGRDGKDGLDGGWGVGIDDIYQQDEDVIINLTNGNTKRFKMPNKIMSRGGGGGAVNLAPIFALIETKADKTDIPTDTTSDIMQKIYFMAGF